jgi:CRISPR/Cas system-associated exonuclease Cas4 (RecB family)
MIPDLVEAVTKTKEKKIIRFPNDFNRASSIGYAVPELDGCLRRGVYERTHWEDKELHDVRAQFVFDEGHQQEQQVIKDLLDAGIVIANQSKIFTIYDTRFPGKKVLLRMSIDFEVVIEEQAGRPTKTITAEVKSMNPNIFSTVNEFDDFRKKPWTLAYMAQMMAYLLADNREVGIFILKDKSNGTLKQINVPLDYELGEAVLKTAEAINDHVDAGTLPPHREDIDKCGKCPFKKVCLPDIDFDIGPQVGDDPMLEKRIDRYMELVEQKKEAEELYKKSISPKMKSSANGGKLNLKLGKYRLTGNTDVRGTFRPKIKLESEIEE